MPNRGQVTVTTTYDWTARSGNTYTLEVGARFELLNYGADADGRRGELRYELISSEILDNPFRLDRMGQEDYDEWVYEGPTVTSMKEDCLDRAEIS